MLFSFSQVYVRVGIEIGLVPIPINISGTGSMFPTFPKGEGVTYQEQSNEVVEIPVFRAYPGGFSLLGHEYLKHKLSHGDIVSFRNSTTDAIILGEGGDLAITQGFVKRVIGLPGDSIELRDGFVFRNNSRVVEPYIASARSTFGGAFLPDCKPLLVPNGMVFVMGDNRKASNDSRHDLGLISINDIDFVLPLPSQVVYQDRWRDPSEDTTTAAQPLLNKTELIQAINEIRLANNKPALKNDTRLDTSAKLRAQAILRSGDLSFEATQSGLTMKQAMTKANYSNITWGEIPVLGYYSAEELVESMQHVQSMRTFLLNEDFDDIGVASMIGELNACPTQVVVTHVAGYIPPNYSQSQRDSWIDSVTSLERLRENWLQARGYGGFYEDNKQDIEKVISMIEERLAIATRIRNKIVNEQWLNDQDNAEINKLETLAEQHQALASDLNSRN